MAYTRTYVYTNSDNNYRTSAQDYAFSAFKISSGDTEHAITKIISIEATTYGYVGTSQSAAKLGWTATLITGAGNFAATTTNASKTNPGKWGALYLSWDVSQITPEALNSLTTFRSDADGGSGTKVKAKPIYLTITFESGEYFPTVDRFEVQRCDASGTPDAEGIYAKYAFTLRVAKKDSAAASEAVYSIILSDGQGHNIINSTAFATVNGYVSVSGLTTTARTNYTYAGGVETPFTLSLIYHGEAVTEVRTLFPSSTMFSIGEYGVGIGTYAKGSATEKRHDVDMNAYFHKQVSFLGGVAGIPNMAYGQTADTPVSSGSYVDVSIGYAAAGFTEPPVVLCGFWTGSTAGSFGRCSVAAYNVTETGCTVRIFNGDSSQRSPQATWIAIGT